MKTAEEILIEHLKTHDFKSIKDSWIKVQIKEFLKIMEEYTEQYKDEIEVLKEQLNNTKVDIRSYSRNIEFQG